MKTISKFIFGIVAITTIFSGCNDGPATQTKEVVKPVVAETSLGLRKTNLYAEDDTLAAKTEYRATAPGTSQNLKRAFQDAPPMIPHSVDGMLPIKIESNQCLSCHTPDTAKLVGATSVPKSHFTNFRPSTYIIDGEVVKSGIVVNNTSSEDLTHVSIIKQGTLVGARFNCTQCHAPQSQGNLAVENNFEADFTAKDGANRSTWEGTKLMEGIDTMKSGL